MARSASFTGFIDRELSFPTAKKLREKFFERRIDEVETIFKSLVNGALKICNNAL